MQALIAIAVVLLCRWIRTASFHGTPAVQIHGGLTSRKGKAKVETLGRVKVRRTYSGVDAEGGRLLCATEGYGGCRRRDVPAVGRDERMHPYL